MHTHFSTITKNTCTSFGVFVLLMLVVVSCGEPPPQPARHTTPAAATQVPLVVATPPPLPQIGQLSSDIDQLARQVLQNIREHGWNDAAQIRGKTTGGLYINWKMDDPTQTNALRQGSDDATAGSHDPQVELYYLNALAEYKTLHPQDHSFDTEIQKATPYIEHEFANYNLPKGWIYFFLLRTGSMLNNPALINEAYSAAQNYFNHWYDPTIGIVYNRAHSPGNYNVEHTLNCGAALIDAGTRWHQSAWVQAGTSTIDHTLAAAFDSQAHLFFNNVTVQTNGQQQVLNHQAKPSTQGNGVGALVTAYNVTHNRHYLDVAGQILQSMFASSLWDQERGGLFFALDLDTNKLEQSYKETRAQTLTLIALYRYNLALQQMKEAPQFLDKQAKLIDVLAHHFYQSTYHGFFYRVTPDFQVYHSSPGKGIGTENYFTTEAMGTGMDALQQTEFAQIHI